MRPVLLAATLLAMLVAHGAFERLMNLLVIILPVGRIRREADVAHP